MQFIDSPILPATPVYSTFITVFLFRRRLLLHASFIEVAARTGAGGSDTLKEALMHEAGGRNRSFITKTMFAE